MKSLTKKNYVNIAVKISVLLFVPFFLYMPIQMADGVRAGNIFMLLFYSGFLAVTVAAIVVICLFTLTRKDYVKAQYNTLYHFRHLIKMMVKREFVTRYRRNVLGILWSVLNPILTMLVFTMVFSMVFRFHIPDVPFPVYVLSGQLMFIFFSESTSAAMGSITSNAATIKRFYLPKYIFPVTKVMSSLINLGFSFVAFLVVVLVTGATFNATILLVFIPITYIFVFSLGIGMILSSLTVFFRDITYLYGIGITLLMFLTPIFYPVEILPPRIFHLIHLNPLFHYVSYFRDVAVYGVIPGLWANIVCIGFALAAVCGGLYTIASQQDKYILYL